MTEARHVKITVTTRNSNNIDGMAVYDAAYFKVTECGALEVYVASDAVAHAAFAPGVWTTASFGVSEAP